MTYEELSTESTTDDFSYIRSFDQRMKLAMSQWEALNARLPLADPVDRVRIEANMEQMKDTTSACVKEIVDFIDKLGIDLYDHYGRVRSICPHDDAPARRLQNL